MRAACLGAVLLLSAGGPLLAQPAAAGAVAERSYQIEPGTLNEALNRFARRAGITLSFTPQQIEGLRSRGLNGPYTVEAGLAALLSGTGLTARAQAPDQYVLQARPPAPPAPPPQAAPPQAAPAAPAMPASAEPPSLATVTVVAERLIEPANTASAQTLGREALERFPATSPGDLLREVTGVTVANSRNGSSLDVNIRGMQGFGRVKILVDGTESSGSTYKGYGGETTQAYVDPELLGEIKVEKGPNAGPYGAGVVGGVVSMSTLTADDLIPSGQRLGLRLRGTWVNQPSGTTRYAIAGPGLDGSAAPADAVTRDVSLPGRSWNGSLAGAWRLLDDKLELVAGLSHRQSGNYVSGQRGDVLTESIATPGLINRVSLYRPGQTVYNTSQDTDSVLLKAALKLPNEQKISLGYSQLKSRFGEARSAGFAEYIAQLNLSHVDKQLYSAQYAWSPVGNPWVDLRVNVWASDSTGYQAADIRTGGPETHRAAWTDTQARGLEAWNTSVMDLPVGPLTFKYGVTWLREDVEVSPLDNGTYMDPSGQRSLRSVFAQAELQPTDWLLLNAGLRRERYEVRGRGETDSGIAGQVLPLNIAHGETRTNPSLGLAIQPSEALQFFARYSEGWRPPTVKETVNSLVAASNTARVLLKPERTDSQEAGVKLQLKNQWLPNDRFNAGLTLFDNVTHDYTYGFAGEFKNAGRAQFRGWELSLAYDAGGFFSRYSHTRYRQVAFCGIDYEAGGGCADMPRILGLDTSSSGFYVPPRSQTSVTLGTRLLEKRLTLGLRMTAAKAYVTGGVLIGGWDSHEVYDLFGSWRIHRHLDLAFAVENLRDRFYMDASTSTMLAIPSPGRTAKVTLTYTF